MCEILIANGACVNTQDLWGFTPLMEAASKSRVEVCSLLLCHGADPAALNCHSKSAMDLAGSRELQERLAFEYRGHAVLHTCRTGDIIRLKKNPDQLIQQFQHPFTQENALHVALVHWPPGQMRKCVETLIKKGVGVNDKTKEGVTPLHIVCDRPEMFDIIDVLIKNGANINATDNNGDTRKCRLSVYHPFSA